MMKFWKMSVITAPKLTSTAPITAGAAGIRPAGWHPP